MTDGMTNGMKPPVAAEANPHFRQIGGAPAIERLVTAFYRRMDTLPQAAGIRAMHEADLGPTRRVLHDYLCEWMGGPRDYSARRGPPRLRRRHAAFAIGTAERDAWLACMQGALDEVVPDAHLRRQLLQAFTQIADHLRNTEGSPHEHRPG